MSLTEHQIEECRWRAQRIIRSTYSFVEPWQKSCSFQLLGNTKRGKTPSKRVVDNFRKAWVFFLQSRECDIDEDMSLIDED